MTPLGMIRAGIEGRTSKAAYLHGSFGSGKSHFMAVPLSAAAAQPRGAVCGGTGARGRNGTTPGFRARNSFSSRITCSAPRTMESHILGEYVNQVQRLHPARRLPGVYRAEALFKDAQNLRADMGDELFFRQAQPWCCGATGVSGWGEIGAGWDASVFEAAIAAPPKAEDRVRLVGDLVEKFFTYARERGFEFVDLDTGLSIISKHAKSLWV